MTTKWALCDFETDTRIGSATLTPEQLKSYLTMSDKLGAISLSNLQGILKFPRKADGLDKNRIVCLG